MNYYIGDYPSNNFNAPQQGWICPKCGRVYSPSTSMCWYCGGNTTTVINTTTPSNTTGSTTPYKFPDIITSTKTIPVYLDTSSLLNHLIDNLEE